MRKVHTFHLAHGTVKVSASQNTLSVEKFPTPIQKWERLAACLNFQIRLSLLLVKKTLAMEKRQTKMETETQRRYQQVLEQISQLRQLTGNQQLEILAVSKVHPSSAIREVYALGQRSFGENYVQELLAKAEELRDLDIYWSYIGHIQSNKIKNLVVAADEIQTLASLKHARLIHKHSESIGKSPFKVYIAVNAEGEDGKNGVAMDEVEDFCSQVQKECPNLKIMGLMCIPPKSYQDNLEEPPQLYHKLRSLADQVGEGQLSLGMSGDLRIASAAGSNLVRIGTAIFGSRPPKG